MELKADKGSGGGGVAGIQFLMHSAYKGKTLTENKLRVGQNL
jgi:hypothetical protein